MSTEENKALVRRWFEELGKDNIDAADEIFAADCVLHHPSAPPNLPPGPEGVRQFLAPFFAAMHSTKATIEHLVAEGDKVAAFATISATHHGEFAGMQGTGKPVSFIASSIIRFADGKVAEVWQIDDNLSLMQQVGAIPSPNSPG